MPVRTKSGLASSWHGRGEAAEFLAIETAVAHDPFAIVPLRLISTVVGLGSGLVVALFAGDQRHVPFKLVAGHPRKLTGERLSVEKKSRPHEGGADDRQGGVSDRPSSDQTSAWNQFTVHTAMAEFWISGYQAQRLTGA